MCEFVCVCERERESVWGESRALYIMAKEQRCVCVCVEQSVGESSRVEGQS